MPGGSRRTSARSAQRRSESCGRKPRVMTRPGGTGSARESTRPYAAPTGRSRLRAGTEAFGLYAGGARDRAQHGLDSEGIQEPVARAVGAGGDRNGFRGLDQPRQVRRHVQSSGIGEPQMYCGVISLGKGPAFATRPGGVLAVEDRPATQSAPCSTYTSSPCSWCGRPAGGWGRAQAVRGEEAARGIGNRHCVRDAWTFLDQASGFQYAQIAARRMDPETRAPTASRSAEIGSGHVELLGRTVIPRAGASTTASWLRSIKRLSR